MLLFRTVSVSQRCLDATPIGLPSAAPAGGLAMACRSPKHRHVRKGSPCARLRRRSMKPGPSHQPPMPEGCVGTLNDGVDRPQVSPETMRLSRADVLAASAEAPNSPSSTRTSAPSRAHPLCSLASDDRSEPISDHDLGTVHHLINDVGDAHQSLRLTNRFTRQQTHLLKVARE